MCRECSTGTLSRRGLLAGGLALSGALALSMTMPFASRAFADEAQPVSPDEALKRLVEGNERYVANAAINTDHSVGRSKRSLGQKPFAAIVTCADSRVVPELIFDQGPGELFVIRVAGNFINEDGLASLEYGVAVLGIQAILVLGHTACGAVDATIKSIRDNALPPGHLPSLVNAIRPAVYDVMADKPADLLAAATAKNAQLNAEVARSAGPILSAQHTAGKLKSGAGIYDIATGKVSFI
ncbi:carbonic anhydrase [Ancylobacter pratisalsi]|uniref:carbonic anhydrase n=1 Tax=Ancylobacter pratisalsi TaxID=1745854 RepID=A0A6P1YNC3_9HYPH|nr:carbonic anhydrase [Ancylobacter pratisalsi]QIB33713.1 carbonic anhydrase [Ancylobacter pratisalsi]